MLALLRLWPCNENVTFRDASDAIVLPVTQDPHKDNLAHLLPEDLSWISPKDHIHMYNEGIHVRNPLCCEYE